MEAVDALLERVVGDSRPKLWDAAALGSAEPLKLEAPPGCPPLKLQVRRQAARLLAVLGSARLGPAQRGGRRGIGRR
jgi:hypothetical protein